MARSLNSLRQVRRVVIWLRRLYLTRVWGMDIHPTAEFSLSTRFDRTYPKGVHIGARSYVAFGAVVLTHDTTRRYYADTRVGEHCFIGAASILMPGITVGDGSIVAAGAVVTSDVPPGCIAAGNPARIIRENIKVGPYGRFTDRNDGPAPS